MDDRSVLPAIPDRHALTGRLSIFGDREIIDRVNELAIRGRTLPRFGRRKTPTLFITPSRSRSRELERRWRLGFRSLLSRENGRAQREENKKAFHVRRSAIQGLPTAHAE